MKNKKHSYKKTHTMKTKKITQTEKQKKNNSEFKRRSPTLNNENYPKIQNKPSKSTTINH